MTDWKRLKKELFNRHVTVYKKVNKRKNKYTSTTIPCCVSGLLEVDLHHVRSRGAYGHDESYNLMPLRHQYHVEIEKIGKFLFAKKYPKAAQWLRQNGWRYDDTFKKWWNIRDTREN